VTSATIHSEMIPMVSTQRIGYIGHCTRPKRVSLEPQESMERRILAYDNQPVYTTVMVQTKILVILARVGPKRSVTNVTATCSPLTPAQARPKATAVTIAVSAISIMPPSDAPVVLRTNTSIVIAITITTMAARSEEHTSELQSRF